MQIPILLPSSVGSRDTRPSSTQCMSALFSYPTVACGRTFPSKKGKHCERLRKLVKEIALNCNNLSTLCQTDRSRRARAVGHMPASCSWIGRLYWKSAYRCRRRTLLLSIESCEFASAHAEAVFLCTQIRTHSNWKCTFSEKSLSPSQTMLTKQRIVMAKETMTTKDCAYSGYRDVSLSFLIDAIWDGRFRLRSTHALNYDQSLTTECHN